MRNAAGDVWSGWRWPQLTIADHGRLKLAWSGVGRSKMTMARHRWPWPVMAGPGWPGCSALEICLAMVVVVIAGQGSGMEQTGNAAAPQLALVPISSDKCNKGPTSLLEVHVLCCIDRFRFVRTWQ